jgi:hypothetical protein
MSIETIVYHGYGSRGHEGDYADDVELRCPVMRCPIYMAACMKPSVKNWFLVSSDQGIWPTHSADRTKHVVVPAA